MYLYDSETRLLISLNQCFLLLKIRVITYYALLASLGLHVLLNHATPGRALTDAGGPIRHADGSAQITVIASPLLV
jgi:hypothetical protein